MLTAGENCLCFARSALSFLYRFKEQGPKRFLNLPVRSCGEFRRELRKCLWI